MNRYHDTIRDREGRALPGKLVSVYGSDGELADLEDGMGNAIPNPVTSRGDGLFSFYVADGVYDLVIDGERHRDVAISSSTGDASDYADAASGSADAAASSATDAAASAAAAASDVSDAIDALDDAPFQLQIVHFADLPSAATAQGKILFCDDALKVGETTGNGTGTLAYSDGTAWCRVGDDTALAD